MAKRTVEASSPLFLQEEAIKASRFEMNDSPVSVTGLTKNIRETLESRFTDVLVEGEISNFTHHRSGHRYWTLKDESAQISCVFWKTRQISFDAGDGQKVLCRGRLTVYPPRGNYQLDVFQIRPLGIGALQQAYEALYKRLLEEGLFEESRKRSIPMYPKTIGIITSATGAALHDILTVLRRRYPLVKVLFRAASVQGIGAELDVARGIQEMNLIPETERPDVLIVGRGGGSMEDLWTFNEEAVARAIYTSRIPIISAVGHEVNVMIADFVADLRAPTPTAAAELSTPDRNELLLSLQSSSSTLKYFIESRLGEIRSELSSHLSGYGLKRVLRQALQDRQNMLVQSANIMRSAVTHFIELTESRSQQYQSALRTLDPNSVLERGFALVKDTKGRLVTRSSQVSIDDDLSVRFADDSISVKRTG